MPELRTLDIAAAVDLWHRLAPPNARNVIDARDAKQREVDRERNTAAALALLYWWRADLNRYVNVSGRLISAQAVKQAVNTFAAKTQNQIEAITSRYNDKQIGLPEYATTMRQKVAAGHTASYAVARGGVAQTDAQATSVVDYHLGKLDGFTADLQRGGVSPEATVARARLYGASVSTTFEVGVDDGLKILADSGIKIEVRNILGNAEHCSSRGFTTGCTEESERGWVPYGTMSLPGTRTCLMSCKCRTDHRIVQD